MVDHVLQFGGSCPRKYAIWRSQVHVGGMCVFDGSLRNVRHFETLAVFGSWRYGKVLESSRRWALESRQRKVSFLREIRNWIPRYINFPFFSFTENLSKMHTENAQKSCSLFPVKNITNFFLRNILDRYFFLQSFTQDSFQVPKCTYLE